MYIDDSGMQYEVITESQQTRCCHMSKSKLSVGKFCKIYIQTAVTCLDNKYIGHIGSNIWSMCKYMNVQQQSTYTFHAE